jgi:hypothetical protein
MNKQFWNLLTKHIENPARYNKPDGADLYLEQLKTKYDGIPYREAFFLMRNGMEERPKHSCGTSLVFDPATYRYKKSCPVCGRKAHNKTPLTVNGIFFESKEEARKALGLSVYELDQILVKEDPSILERYNNKGTITKEVLTELISKRFTISAIIKQLNSSKEKISFLFTYYNLPTKWYQLDESTYQFLNDENRFKEEFERSNSEELAVRYNCSPSTILQWADKYGIDRGPRMQSKIERDMVDWIKSLLPGITVLERDTTAIGMEIDIFLPEYSLGIEFDGLFYHTDSPPFHNRNKHVEKQKLAYKHRITLLRFVDIGETKHKLDIVKSIIKAKLGLNIKIFARKCDIRPVDATTAKTFFDANHISGHSVASVYYGLYYNNELIELCSFAKSRFNNDADWELIRLASKQGITVVGGLSKLVKHFKRNHEGSLVTYANLRFGTGAGYLASGFTYVSTTTGGYFYTDMKRLYSRHMFNKKNIQKLCPIYDDNLPEHINAWNNGFKRYRDCGHSKFILI